MPYRVRIDSAVRRDLRRLPPDLTERILAVLAALADNPRPHGVKALPPHRGLLRVREGDYRVVYRVHDDRKEVEVVIVGDRREVYKKLTDRA